jgi:hypothetical protein
MAQGEVKARDNASRGLEAWRELEVRSPREARAVAWQMPESWRWLEAR